MAFLSLSLAALQSAVAIPAVAPMAALVPQADEIRKAGQHGMEGLLPVMAQAWESNKPMQRFPLQGLPFPALQFPAQPAVPAAPQSGEPAAVSMAKCQVPSNLTYCTGINYAVPYQGWTEWEVYVEDTLRYYMDYIYDDADDDGRNTTIKISPECKSAMTAIGCAFYFPKCDAQDKPLMPCKNLCTKWKKDLACPGSDTYSCTAANGHSASFAGAGKCTEASAAAGTALAAGASAVAQNAVNLVATTQGSGLVSQQSAEKPHTADEEADEETN